MKLGFLSPRDSAGLRGRRLRAGKKLDIRKPDVHPEILSRSAGEDEPVRTIFTSWPCLQADRPAGLSYLQCPESTTEKPNFALPVMKPRAKAQRFCFLAQ